jgi:chemotaxis protein MotB
MRRGALAIPVVGVLLFLSACASTDWEARYLEKEQENRALQEQYDSMHQNLAEQDASSEVLRKEFDDTREQLDTLSAELQKLRDQPPAAAPVMSESDDYALYERLKAKYGENVQRTPDGNIEITLNSTVTFRSGSYDLTPEGKKILASVAGELNDTFAGHMVRVIGHTDSDPIRKSPFKDNWELGAERALEVIRFLSSNHGVDPSRLMGASRGDTQPLVENSSKEAKSKNRRVEIVVVIPRREAASTAYVK